VKSWLTGNSPVPAVWQRMIALQLNSEQRNIFTDIPPGKQEIKPENEAA